MISYRFDLGQELLVTEFQGALENKAVEGAVRTVHADPRTAETTRHLIDARRAIEHDVSPLDLRHRAALVATYLRFHPRRAVYRTALLVGSEVDFGLGRMFGAFANAIGIHIQVFRDRCEAVEWLGVRITDETPSMMHGEHGVSQPS